MDLSPDIAPMHRALALARAAARLGEVPVGAVVTRDGRLIAQACNLRETLDDPTAHAEVSAIRDACKNLKAFDLGGAEIYTSCEPCPMCLGAIYWARLSRIYYGNTRKDAAAIDFDDDFLYQEIPKDLKDRRIPMVQCDHAEALKVFKEWQQKSDKISY